MINIALVDDEVLFRKGMSLLVNQMKNINVVIQASDGSEFIKLLNENDFRPDVVLLDLNMPNKNGIETTSELKDIFPDLKIVILSTHFNKSFVLHMLELGASSYLPKDTAPDQVELTINNVYKNGFYYTPNIQSIIQQSFQKPSKDRHISLNISLTKRESEILELICNQYTNAEIAKQLFISDRTVEGHRNRLLSKLDCKNTAGMVAIAVQHNLVKLHPRL